MANTYSQLYIQFAFAVKGRENLIKVSFRDELEKVMYGIIINHENAVHKPNNDKAEMFPDLQYMGVVGRYWAFKLHYRQKWVQELKNLKGVYWNASHKCYMAFQNEKVRSRIHQILGPPQHQDHYHLYPLDPIQSK